MLQKLDIIQILFINGIKYNTLPSDRKDAPAKRIIRKPTPLRIIININDNNKILPKLMKIVPINVKMLILLQFVQQSVTVQMVSGSKNHILVHPHHVLFDFIGSTQKCQRWYWLEECGLMLRLGCRLLPSKLQNHAALLVFHLGFMRCITIEIINFRT